MLVGECTDAELRAAIGASLTHDPDEADLVIAYVDGPADLDRAQAVAGARPLWVVYPKGRGVAFGATAVRTILRAQGWRDTKSCAVSERLTATRYARV